jgi:serine protease Do
VRAGGFSALLLLLLVAPARSQAPADSTATAFDAITSDVFRRYADRIVKIQVVEIRSGARASIGTGFFVSSDGLVVTNYHVVASVINAPSRYRAEVIEPAGVTRPVRILGLDAVHDLAVVRADVTERPFFAISRPTLPQGTRLFSLGHPRDLALSIVEGTYNGLHPYALYPRVHLTAPLNPGMSGGPTIDRNGRVIGVNVSTQGNQVSFLVPVGHVIPLLDRAQRGEPPTASLRHVGNQLKQHQAAYLRDMFDSTTKSVDLGPFRVATQPAPYFRCWGDADDSEEESYETVWHRCITDDDVYLDDDQSTGSLYITHQLVRTRTLNRSRFFAAYSEIFGTDNSPSGSKEYVTSWECSTRNVRTAVMPMRTVLCMRRYRRFEQLYDAFLKVAVLGHGDVGLVSTLNLTGVTHDNITRLTERYLGTIGWR